MKAVSTDLTPANIAAVLDLLRVAPARLVALAERVPAGQTGTPLGEGERSLIEDVAHILNSEARVFEEICLALIVRDPLIVSVHPERQFGALVHMERQPLADLLAYHRIRRAILLGTIEQLSDEAWARTVRQEGKQRHEPVYRLARALALHELGHLSDLEQKVMAADWE